MMAQRVVASSWRSASTLLLVLLAGVACGLLVTFANRPMARERGLLWDDYIVATAALYQREGDVARAKERLQKIGVDDPGQTVAMLAAVYVPDGKLADGNGAALRDLAVALTGRNVVTANSLRPSTVADSASPLSDLASGLRSPFPWLALGLLALTWLSLSTAFEARAGQRRRLAHATVPSLPNEDAESRPLADRARPAVGSLPSPANSVGRRATKASVAATLTYRGNGEPYEQMVPIADPSSGKLVGGCGLATGPSAPGVATGHLGLLVWLHESGSAEPPQTLGLVAMPVVNTGEEALREWMAYARLPELVVARPGVTKSFETRRLQATLYVTDVGTTAIGQGNEAVISRLRVHLEVTFKRRSS
jgi:hypothetical protein